MLEVRLQLAIRLHAGGPSAAICPSAASYPSRVGPEYEGHHAACWSPDSSAVDTKDADSGRRLGYGDADWYVERGCRQKSGGF